MKHFLVLLSAIALSSCSESYTVIKPDKFNQKVASRTDISTPEELIRLYYRVDELEDTFNISVSVIELQKDSFEITLIQDHFQDDSMAGIKLVMFANRNNLSWTVNEIRENWKCWSDRGHDSWGTEPCD